MSNKQKIVELTWSGIKVIIVLFYIATIIYSIVKEEGSTAILLAAIFLTTSDFLSTSLKGYKKRNKLSVTEREIGGIPNSSEDIKQAHAAAIEMYIQDHVGLSTDGIYGSCYFNELLNDWAKFDINKRTKHDASISSGLAIMANNRHLYRPNAKVEKPKLNINVSRYTNTGNNSKIIKQ